MNAPFPGETLFRSRLMTLLHTALNIGETRFARRLALAWLAYYPGDLPIGFLHARALVTENHPQQAADILERICQVDIEYLEAFELLARVQKLDDMKKHDLYGMLFALGGVIPAGIIPDWASHLKGARESLAIGSIDRAHELIHHALLAHPDNPLVAATHLQIMASHLSQTTAREISKANNNPRPSLPTALAIRDLAEAYHQRWPSCALFSLHLARALMECNEDDAGVSLLHQVVGQDVTGQVAIRLWGVHHIYRSLWPEKLSILHDQPIPAAVAVTLGWNQLPDGFNQTKQPHLTQAHFHNTAGKNAITASPPHRQAINQKPAEIPHSSETLHSIQDELDKLASRMKQSQLAHNDGRFPVYILFSTQSGLESQYGSTGAAAIDQEMKNVVKATQAYRHWGSMIFYADLGGLGVPPARPNDPWGLKLALVDLDAALAERGERIGAVLIVGGPKVVPFHQLPNPVDDVDVDVPSDNPYGTRDENYFIPEWPVGRLPGDASKNPSLLIAALRKIADQRSKIINKTPWYIRFRRIFQRLLKIRVQETRPSIGYTAAVWRRSSFAAFRPVSRGNPMNVSPPVEKVNGEKWATGSLSYFNLHGVADASEWFGQRDPVDPQDGPDYPIVLSPANIVNSGRSPQVVFSEACYGAHIINRSVEQALALKFLASGSQVVVGSTVTSYGSVTLPLIAADLLARLFWKYLDEGCPAGESLRRAKVSLAREMHKRQGYLDGEDQKTLISFVFYGDPLAQPMGDTRKFAKTLLRSSTPPEHPATVCDRYDPACAPEPISEDILAHVKSVVAQYLPGMSDAQLSLNIERSECNATGHICPTAASGAKAVPAHPSVRRTVVLSKRIEQNNHYHNQFARLTLDNQGKLIKLAVSR